MSDLKRMYVVEVFSPKAGKDAEQTQEPGMSGPWLTVHTTDDQDEAVRVCKEEHAVRKVNTRVRQFWLHSEPPKQRPLKDGETPRVDAPLHDVVCLEHPNEHLRVYDLGVPVHCPTCRAKMVPADFAAGLGEAEDL